jgi:hypothetical protein
MVTLAVTLSAFAGLSDAVAQSCSEPPRNPQNVRVEIVDGEPVFTNHFCPSANGAPGDLCNAFGDRPRMVFKLQGPGSNPWRFLRMELSADGTDWNNPSLPDGVYEDLGFSSDPGDGDRVRGWPPVSLNGSGKQMTVRNDNCFEFDVYYRLILEHEDGRQVPLHPRLRNRGGPS